MSCCAKLWLSPLASAPRQSLSMPQYICRLWAVTPGRVNNRKLYQRGWALENVKLEYDPGYVFLDVFSYSIDQTTKSKMYFSAHSELPELVRVQGWEARDDCSRLDLSVPLLLAGQIHCCQSRAKVNSLVLSFLLISRLAITLHCIRSRLTNRKSLFSSTLNTSLLDFIFKIEFYMSIVLQTSQKK